MGEVVEGWSSTLLSNSLLVDPQVPFCFSVQNIDKMTRSKYWRGLLLNIAQKLSKFEKGCHNILILPLIFAQISLNMPPEMPQSTIVKLKKRHDMFLAVQGSSIGDSALSEWVSDKGDKDKDKDIGSDLVTKWHSWPFLTNWETWTLTSRVCD